MRDPKKQDMALDFRDPWYKTSDGIQGLIQNQRDPEGEKDPELDRLILALDIAHRHLGVHMTMKYNWD